MLNTSKFSDYDILLYFCGEQGDLPGHHPGSIVKVYRSRLVGKDLTEEQMRTIAPANVKGIFGNYVSYN